MQIGWNLQRIMLSEKTTSKGYRPFDAFVEHSQNDKISELENRLVAARD